MTHRVPAGTPHQLPFEGCNLIVEGAPSRQQGLNHRSQLGLLGEARPHAGLEPGTTALGRMRPKIFIRPRIWLIISVRIPTSCLRTPRVARTR